MQRGEARRRRLLAIHLPLRLRGDSRISRLFARVSLELELHAENPPAGAVAEAVLHDGGRGQAVRRRRRRRAVRAHRLVPRGGGDDGLGDGGLHLQGGEGREPGHAEEAEGSGEAARRAGEEEIGDAVEEWRSVR
ncbi:hypothetical protein ACHAWF_018900 [Thalassiosira exigua]